MPKTHCRLFQIGDDDIREHSTIIEPNASSSSFSEFYKIWKKCHFWRSCIDYQMLKYIWLLLVFFPYHGHSCWIERSKYISIFLKKKNWFYSSSTTYLYTDICSLHHIQNLRVLYFSLQQPAELPEWNAWAIIIYPSKCLFTRLEKSLGISLLFLKCIVVTVKKTIYKKINHKIITLLMFLKLFVLLNR